MIYSKAIYDGRLLSRPFVVGSRVSVITIPYTPGMAAMVKASWGATLPPNTYLTVETGTAEGGYVPIAKSGDTATLRLTAETAGNEDILMRVTLATSDLTQIPRLHSISVTISQRVSYANILHDILTDAGLTPSEYWIDPELQDFHIPYGWMDATPHREAVRQVAEAVISQVFCDRNGIVRVEGPNYLKEQKQIPALEITASEYYSKDNPSRAEEVANYIIVYANPVKPAEVAEEVFSTTEEIAAGETRTITAYYNDKPVIEAVASIGEDSPVGAAISEAVYYSWGATIKVASPINSGDVNVIVMGKPLRVTGRKRIVAQDSVSIADIGKREYELPDNPLIQTEEMARKIANLLLAYKDQRKDLTMNWRGNPALGLGDRIITPDYGGAKREFHVSRRETTYDGVLEENLEGKAVG